MSRKRKKTKFACWCEYVVLRFACAVVNAIPYRLACAIARGLASFAFSCGFHKRRTLERIKTVFPEKDGAECRRIAVFSLQNVMQSAVEMIRAHRLDRKWIDAHVKDVQVYADRLRSIMDEGRGAVIFVPHCGNWYMAAWAMARHGIPISAIAARQRNPYVEAWMQRQYGSIDVMTRGSATVLHDVLSRIAAGRAFAILPDLRAASPDTEVRFLNGTANVSHGGAMFAVASGAPVVVAIMRRENGMHTFDHLATLRPDPGARDRREEARRIMREAMALIDEGVRKTPEQWFWYNSRWILQPAKRKKHKKAKKENT
jgi:KDO2-lipid IV(A) lauroyltransferase